MNLSDFLIVSSIITGLISIPFLAPTIGNDYIPTGSLLLGFNKSDVEDVPGMTSSFYTPEKFEREIQTPFGRFKFSIMAEKVFQELTKPDKRIIVIEMPEYTSWLLKSQSLLLNVTRTSLLTIEECTTPDGWIRRTKENGGTSETYYGHDFELLEERCEQAEKVLQAEVERMESLKKKMLGIPPNIVINEFLPDPEGNEADTYEWVELLNKEKFDVNLTGWELCYKSRPDSSEECYVLDGKYMSSQSYLVLNESELNFELRNSGGLLELKKHDKLVDKVAYGDYDDGNLVDNAPGPDQKVIEGSSIARCPDGSDSGTDSIDFISVTIQTPMNKNECS